ncbi:MAG: M15 family metallopeptidase [Endomicrobiia bacterium]
MPLTQVEVEKLFGKFKYTDIGGGRIKIDPLWVKKNIVKIKLPILGVVEFHKKLKNQLLNIFKEINNKKLEKEIDTDDYRRFGGTFVPRHILWDSKKPLSRHSWGIAIDINVSQNPYGKAPKQHPEIVKIFTENGFEWGGSWKIPDGMHFEVARCEL